MGSIRDNRKALSETGHSTDDQEAHQLKIGRSAVHIFSATIIDPDSAQGIIDAVSILPVESGWAPNGITLIRVGIKTKPASTYSVNFEEWTQPVDPAPSTIATVATTGGTQAETDSLSDSDIAAGSIIMADLPATDINELVVWGEFTID